jgi:hypothetical protein
MRDLPPGGELQLERADLLAEDEPAAMADTIDSFERIAANVLPLAREVICTDLGQ